MTLNAQEKCKQEAAKSYLPRIAKKLRAAGVAEEVIDAVAGAVFDELWPDIFHTMPYSEEVYGWQDDLAEATGGR